MAFSVVWVRECVGHHVNHVRWSSDLIIYCSRWVYMEASLKPGVFLTNAEGYLVHLYETPRDMTKCQYCQPGRRQKEQAVTAESGYSLWVHYYDPFTYKQ